MVYNLVNALFALSSMYSQSAPKPCRLCLPKVFESAQFPFCLVSTIIYATPVHTWSQPYSMTGFPALHHLFFLHQLVLNTYSQIDTRADDNSLNCFLTRSFQDLDLALSPVLSLITIPTTHFFFPPY